MNSMKLELALGLDRENNPSKIQSNLNESLFCYFVPEIQYDCNLSSSSSHHRRFWGNNFSMKSNY
ncbi:hypothetical protein DERP_011367 [Dermatophagoides pteronyssinus]|uniref:Uncharacterized protein n=1 Tax=Dermatophagoides pteronyssinus TaxID=6956 RepID=A0ABQ8J7H1_DERPT|nr:hypothetical protein DERP_011367 [Dermatophagoides pteronyssinus]